jgi:ADP-heptose:LPS heptosyltransferase
VGISLDFFKNAQVDYLFSEENEVERLLRILKEEKILKGERAPEFLFPEIPESRRGAIDEQIQVFRKGTSGPLVAINLSAKREANEWPPERFGMLAGLLIEKHDARILFIGGPRDARIAEEIAKKLPGESYLIVAPNFSLLETRVLLSYCDFLISNDTGAVHLAAATGVGVVGFYTVRNVFGKWFPYGRKKIILAHRFFSCDYNQEACIQKSIEAISVEEAFVACEKMMQQIKKYE